MPPDLAFAGTRLQGSRARITVSLSHTTQVAVAVVVKVLTMPDARGTVTPATAAEQNRVGTVPGYL